MIIKNNCHFYPFFRTKKPQSAMCLGVVGSDGNAMPLHWFTKKKDKKGVDTDHYLEVMEEVVRKNGYLICLIRCKVSVP